MWPELDKLLWDEDDATVATPYTATILEYRVVYHDRSDAVISEANGHANGYANGHTVYDAQHPCRYKWRTLEGFFCEFLIATIALMLFSCDLMYLCFLLEDLMLLQRRSFIVLHLIDLARIWSLIFLALDFRKLIKLFLIYLNFRSETLLSVAEAFFADLMCFYQI